MTRIAIQIGCADWDRTLHQVRNIVRRAARAASPAGSGTVTILLTDDAVVRDLNARFRGKDAPTNVLAFPPAPGAVGLGDIALGYGVCVREAAEQGKPLADHLTHLVIHGVLHLGGYDHQTDGEASMMEALERRLLAQLGVDDPYAGGSLDEPHG